MNGKDRRLKRSTVIVCFGPHAMIPSRDCRILKWLYLGRILAWRMPLKGVLGPAPTPFLAAVR